MNPRRSRRDRRLPTALGAVVLCAGAAFAVPTAGAQGQPLPPEEPVPTPSASPSPSATTPSPDPEDSPTGTPDGGQSSDGGATDEPAPGTSTPTPSETASPEVEEPEPVPPDPLEVTIERLTPSTVPQRGDVVVTGTVTNRSDAEWTDLAAYLLTSEEPLTTAQELRDAVASDPRGEVGSRIITPGLYVDLPSLDPGETTRYKLSVPRSQLGISGAPGVYWLGVHVLGTSDEGRLGGADGRARTFLPLVPERTHPIEMALGLQLRQRTARLGDGSLAASGFWERALSDDGRLRRILDLGATAGTRPLTWVLDPAVEDAALSMARGNPALDLTPEPTPDLTKTDGGTDGGTDGNAQGDGDAQEEQSGGQQDASRSTANAWLTDLVAALRSGDDAVLTVPYGDLDVSAVTRNGVDALLDTAFEQGDRLLEELGILGGSRALVPADGFLSPASVTRADPAVPVVLAHDAVPSGDGHTVLDREGGGEVMLVPGADTLEGPQPDDPRSALAVRQRILADAALEALGGGRPQPLVRLLPADWDPGPQWQRAQFFAGLDVPWVVPTQLRSLLDRPVSGPTIDPADDVAYPSERAEEEVPTTLVGAALSLIDTGGLLDELLTENDQMLADATRQALLGPSTWSRERPKAATRRTRAGDQRIEDWLQQISVRGPDFVTMSSESGTFQVTLVNGLDQPVTVGLRTAVSGGLLVLSSPEPVQLAPQGRAAVRIEARSNDIGLHRVVLQPVSPTGERVGSIATIDVRSSRVGFILWIVMAAGGTLLFVAIVVRLVRRIARRRRTHGPLLKQEAR